MTKKIGLQEISSSNWNSISGGNREDKADGKNNLLTGESKPYPKPDSTDKFLAPPSPDADRRGFF